MRKMRSGLTVLVVCIGMLWTGTAGALTPGEKCEIDKLNAAWEREKCLAEQEIKNVKGESFDLAECESNFDEALDEADAKAAEEGAECADLAAYLSESNSLFPASGQTTAYQADKDDGIVGEVAVPDDGTVQAGALLSYTDNGDGTITDNNTLLMWEKKDLSGGLHDRDNTFRWSGDGSQETIRDWLDDVNAEGGTGFAGFNDWRIPNVKELASIVDYERTNPSIDPVFNTDCTAACTLPNCSCTAASNYWMSTTAAINPAVAAWNVDFNLGNVGDGGKTVNDRVRAVRGGL